MGIILAFEQDGKLMVTNSTMTSNYKNVGVTAVRGVVSAFLEGNIVYQEAMNQYGFSTGGTLNAASLASPTVPVTIEGGEGYYTVNGAEPKSGDYKVGDVLVFKPNAGTDLSITVNDGAAVEVASGSEWTYVVPASDSITISVEAAA